MRHRAQIPSVLFVALLLLCRSSLCAANVVLDVKDWFNWIKSIGQSELNEAIERVVMGPERKSRLISDEEKRIIAYHEAGHAVAMNAIPESRLLAKA